jgi:hypothetical protein
MDLAKTFMLIAIRARAARLGGSSGVALERLAAWLETSSAATPEAARNLGNIFGRAMNHVGGNE